MQTHPYHCFLRGLVFFALAFSFAFFHRYSLNYHLNGTSTNCLYVHVGGRDTAGLGGKGGPYRLDAGHKVYQISQAEKDAVPDEVKRAAREMGEKAFKQRYTHLSLSFIIHSVQTLTDFSKKPTLHPV